MPLTPEQFHAFLAGRENEAVEFKPGLLGRKELAEYAVGLCNSGGGWLFMGVSDRVPRRILAFDWPTEAELLNTRQSIYDSARIRVDFERIEHPDGPVLAMRIPARPRGAWFHTQDGKHLIRLDEGLRGLTLAEMDAIRREAGAEPTAESVPGDWAQLVRSAGMEALRELMREMQAAPELAAQPDADLLRSLGLVTESGDMSAHLARLLKQAGQAAPEVKPILEVNPDHALVKKLDSSAHFDDLAHILFDQALLAEGGQLEDPAAYVRRVNSLLLNATV